MFSRHLHPSPLGFAAGLFLVALWIAVWASVFATVSLEARAHGRARRATAPSIAHFDPAA
jgi:hypothetical protein